MINTLRVDTNTIDMKLIYAFVSNHDYYELQIFAQS
jgi:hypothetical protein